MAHPVSNNGYSTGRYGAMIGFIIRSCLHHRLLVLLISVLLCVLGARAIQHTAVDAIPDLSDVQVIIKTSYPGQAPN